jgi:hypothetical protein
MQCSTQSKGVDPHDPREVIHVFRGRSPQAPRELIHTLKEERSPHASGEVIQSRSREAIHTIKGGHPHPRGRPSTCSKGVDPRVPREVFHAFRGRSSTRSKGGYPRAPREVFHVLHARDPREVIHTIQGRLSTLSEGGLPHDSSTSSEGGLPRVPREVIHAIRGRSFNLPRFDLRVCVCLEFRLRV